MTMAARFLGPRKQRTRQHVIADLSVHHVEGYILEESHTPCRLTPDYGYDLVLFTHDGNGYLEPGSVYIQLKAAEALHAAGAGYVFDLDIRDYKSMDVGRDAGASHPIQRRASTGLLGLLQRYFAADATRHPKKGAKTVRVRVPVRQPVNRTAVAGWRDLKWEALRRPRGGTR
jgi:hypothetical protein